MRQDRSNIASAIQSNLEEGSVVVTDVSKDRLSVILPTSSVAVATKAMHRIAANPEVHFVEQVQEMRLLNNYGKEVTRGATLSSSNLSGLTGDGQIVGVADSGLDYDSCFFRDDAEVVTIGR